MRVRAYAHDSVPTVGHLSALWRDNREASRADAEEGSVSFFSSVDVETAAAAEGKSSETPTASVGAATRSFTWSEDDDDDEGGVFVSSTRNEARPSPRMRSTSTPHIASFVITSSFSRLGTLLTCAFLDRDG
jgi:hypothetical protein